MSLNPPSAPYSLAISSASLIVEHAVLYLGAYELQNSIEVPYKVVINEALEIAKLYGAEGGFKLINASLDKLAKKLRTMETNNT
jgi:N utilization substance protein B